MPVEPRAPVGIMLMQEEGGRRLQGYPATTEEPSNLPEVFKINQAGLPGESLSFEAEAVSQVQAGAELSFVALPKIAEDRYRESRMREIRLSGLRRGDSIYVTTARPRPRG